MSPPVCDNCGAINEYCALCGADGLCEATEPVAHPPVEPLWTGKTEQPTVYRARQWPHRSFIVGMYVDTDPGTEVAVVRADSLPAVTREQVERFQRTFEATLWAYTDLAPTERKAVAEHLAADVFGDGVDPGLLALLSGRATEDDTDGA